MPRPRATREAEDEYAAYLKSVERLLDTKARELRHPRYSGKVIVCFHIGQDGHVSNRDLCLKSGHPEGDRFALGVVAAVDTLPLPPPSAPSRRVVWVYSFRDDPATNVR